MKFFSLFLALVLSLQGQYQPLPAPTRDPEPITAQDAIQCLQAELDTTYKGQFEGFLDFYDNMTIEDAQEQYDANVEGEAQFFFHWLGLEDPESMDGDVIEPSLEQLARAQALYREIYAKSDYTVLSAEGMDGSSFALKVQIRPLDLYTQMDERYDDHFAPFWAEIDQMNLDAMSDEEFSHWYRTVYAPQYYDACLELLEECASNLGYQAPQTVTAILRQMEDGSLLIDNESWQTIDNRIIGYTADE